MRVQRVGACEVTSNETIVQTFASAQACVPALPQSGIVAMPGPATIFWAALLSFSDAAGLILGLTLPALLCRAEDVARTSAGTFMLSYGGTVVMALASGAAWDLSGMPALAFVPLAVGAVALTAIATRMWRIGELR